MNESSAIVFFKTGWMTWGAISANGWSTNVRWCMRGCGIVKFEDWIIKSSYNNMSMSMIRSRYTPFMVLSRRPTFFSIAWVTANNVAGFRVVSIATATFRYVSCET